VGRQHKPPLFNPGQMLRVFLLPRFGAEVKKTLDYTFRLGPGWVAGALFHTTMSRDHQKQGLDCTRNDRKHGGCCPDTRENAKARATANIPNPQPSPRSRTSLLAHRKITGGQTRCPPLTPNATTKNSFLKAHSIRIYAAFFQLV
jgi:hypothetical protein